MAEIWALAALGCREGEARDGRIELAVWREAADADGAVLVALLQRVGIAATVQQATETVDWQEALRYHHQPVTIGNRLRLRPPWADVEPGLVDVIIDPGMAFGTGQHATTRGCLELLLTLPAQGPLLDAGCGSGVLAIAACKLGFDPVTAIDFDHLATEATAKNAAANGVVIRTVLGDLTAVELDGSATIVANLTATILAQIAPLLARTPPARLIVSGITDREVDTTLAVFAPLGLLMVERTGADGWAALSLEGR